MSTRVLFLCPHSAGKSLAAATYFRAAAIRSGLEVELDVAGPDPDADNMASVTEALRAQGYTIDWNPRLVTAADTEAADLVISVGCEPGTIPTEGAVIEWHVPMLSEDFDGSMGAIHREAEALAADLAPRASVD